MLGAWYRQYEVVPSAEYHAVLRYCGNTTVRTASGGISGCVAGGVMPGGGGGHQINILVLAPAPLRHSSSVYRGQGTGKCFLDLLPLLGSDFLIHSRPETPEFEHKLQRESEGLPSLYYYNYYSCTTGVVVPVLGAVGIRGLNI